MGFPSYVEITDMHTLKQISLSDDINNIYNPYEYSNWQ